MSKYHLLINPGIFGALFPRHWLSLIVFSRKPPHVRKLPNSSISLSVENFVKILILLLGRLYLIVELLVDISDILSLIHKELCELIKLPLFMRFQHQVWALVLAISHGRLRVLNQVIAGCRFDALFFPDGVVVYRGRRWDFRFSLGL